MADAAIGLTMRTPYPWQQPIWEKLHLQQSGTRSPHSLLMQGVPDSGADTFALLFAHALLCTSALSAKPCGSCQDCMLLAADAHPNLQILSPLVNDDEKVSKIIKVDQVRDVIDFVMQTSMRAGPKIILIHPAEVMNPNAANALLKSLEEPPENTRFILVTNNPGRLMATIRSRCQVTALPMPTAEMADRWLTPFIADPRVRSSLLAFSGGNPLLVQRWQEQSLTGQILQLRKDLADLLSGKASPLATAKNWLGSGSQHLGWWLRWLLLECKGGIDMGQAGAEPSLPLTQKQLLVFMQKLQVAKRQLEGSANPNEQLLLESLLLDWQNHKPA